MSANVPDDPKFDVKRIVGETFVREVVCHAAVDSTNDSALRLVAANPGLATPTLVLAARQTAGRGRGSNRWWSAPGALTFSLVIDTKRMNLTPALWPRVSLTVGLSVCLALDEILPGDETRLKWPNDVHASGRKICGVLVEVGPRATETLVLGVGINVNNSFDRAPHELKGIATSLIDVTGRRSDLTDVLVCVARQFEIQLSRLAARDPGLAADWRGRCALTGRQVEVRTGTVSRAGTCQGIDDEGALVLSGDEGPVRLFGGVVSRVS